MAQPLGKNVPGLQAKVKAPRKAEQAAATLQLEYGYQYAGFGYYTAFLNNLCNRLQLFIVFS